MADSRIAQGCARAQRAKIAAAVTAGAAFAVLIPLAKLHHPGKPRPKPTPLAAPPEFVKVIRANLLQAGVLAPPQQPPQVSTGVS